MPHLVAVHQPESRPDGWTPGHMVVLHDHKKASAYKGSSRSSSSGSSGRRRRSRRLSKVEAISNGERMDLKHAKALIEQSLYAISVTRAVWPPSTYLN